MPARRYGCSPVAVVFSWFFCLPQQVVSVCLRRCLSLFCYWFISVPPVRGGTYFSLPPQRKVGKRKRLKPLVLKRVSWLGGGSGASGICALAHSALVTRQSYFRRRCARRAVLQKTARRIRRMIPCKYRSLQLHAVVRRATEKSGASPRRSRWPPPSKKPTTGFPCRPFRRARSARREG